MVGKGNGLGPLEMGIAGHQGLQVFFRHGQESFFEPDQQLHDFRDFPLHVHMHVQGYLVVPAPGCMETGSCIPDFFCQGCLDVHMDVFQFCLEREFSFLDLRQDLFQALFNGRAIFLADDPGAGQHMGMGHAPPDIFVIQSLVIIDGRIESIYQCVGVFAEPSTP